jgi:hypothetical protein
MAADPCQVCEGDLEVGVAGLLICTECGKKYAKSQKRQSSRSKPKKRASRKPPNPTPDVAHNYFDDGH